MEPIAIAFAVGLGTLPSIQPMTLNECDLKAKQEQVLCVMVEEPCSGKECGEPIVKKKQAYKKWYTSKKTGKRVYRTVRR